MASYSFERLPEVFPTTAQHTAVVTRGLREQKIRPIRRGLYTTNMTEPLETVVRRHLWPIVAILAPGAVISHRTALDARPTPRGMVVVTAGYARAIDLPGLRIRMMTGKGALPTDSRFIEDLHMSSQARSLLECLSGKVYGDESPFLSSGAIETWLEKLIPLGEARVNAIRDEAKAIAPVLGYEKEFDRLNQIIGTLLGTKKAKLSSPTAIARAAGDPYDPKRLELFQILFQDLAAWPAPSRPDPVTSNPDFQNIGFYDAYFSNYIEGTRFEVDEAIDITFNNKIPAARPDDAHDVLGTFRIVSNVAEMTRKVSQLRAVEFLDLIRGWHHTIMQSRHDKRPGEFKVIANQAGQTRFVEPQHVEGTLRRGFEMAAALPTPFARAMFLMFIIAEVHPFDDGNGRVARAIMNAELIAHQERRIIVPTSYRTEYVDSLRLLSRDRSPRTFARMADFAQDFTFDIDFSDMKLARVRLEAWNAFDEASDAHLRRPQ